MIGEVDTRMRHSAVSRVLLCSGSVYYELRQRRHHRADMLTAIVRVEQLSPDLLEDLRPMMVVSRPASATVTTGRV